MEKTVEKGLMQMEALLHHSTCGVHALFDNRTIARILRSNVDSSSYQDLEKIKKVQDLLTQLIAKRSYNEKLAFLEQLEPESLEIIIRTYFQIVENTIRANTTKYH